MSPQSNPGIVPPAPARPASQLWLVLGALFAIAAGIALALVLVGLVLRGSAAGSSFSIPRSQLLSDRSYISRGTNGSLTRSIEYAARPAHRHDRSRAFTIGLIFRRRDR
jgi:hypothetical protein